MISNFKNRSLFSVYLLGFLFSIQVSIQNFIDSSYLSTLMPDGLVGLIYTIEAILAIFGFLLMPKILSKFGNFRVAIILLLIEIISLLGLTLYHNIIAAAVFMVGSIGTITFLSFSFDIFLEGFSVNESTGRIRGVYLTFMNLAWVFGPLLAGMILVNGDYSKIYIASIAMLIPVFIILRLTLNNFKDSKYQNTAPIKTIKQVWKDKDVLYIFMSVLFLQIFYAWMTIYTPIYMHLNWGFSWGQIGVIFGIMLIPFVLVQFPLGNLADKKYGEKEILSLGFVIMAVSTGVIFFINNGNVALQKVLFLINLGSSKIEITGYVILWGIILFVTRIGAAAVEVMCDVYFFKKVDNQNVNLISFFRMARPFAYIIGPLLATIILCIPGYGLKNLFLVLGLLMLVGIGYSLAIKDSK